VPDGALLQQGQAGGLERAVQPAEELQRGGGEDLVLPVEPRAVYLGGLGRGNGGHTESSLTTR